MKKNLKNYPTILAFIIFLILWEIVSKSGLFNINLFPPPTKIWKTFLESLATGELVKDVSISLTRAIIGFAIGSTIGIILGILTGRIAIFRLTIGQVAHFLRNIPSIAFVPLAIVWLGIGETSKILLVMWGVIFPVWISTHQGMINVDKHHIWAIKSLGANKLQTLKEAILPSSIPFVVSGMRIGIAIAFITLVASEMAGAFSGVGYRILTSHLVFRVDKMVLGIVTLGIMGLIADRLYVITTKNLFPWIEIK
jgi:ABC-type nitrate/sulfonate/bicarbonate transport system permease component